MCVHYAPDFCQTKPDEIIGHGRQTDVQCANNAVCKNGEPHFPYCELPVSIILFPGLQDARLLGKFTETVVRLLRLFTYGNFEPMTQCVEVRIWLQDQYLCRGIIM